MAVKEFVGTAIKIKQYLTFDMKELQKTIKLWFKDRGYSVVEQSYGEKPSGETKKTFFYWAASKKMDPYCKLCIELVFNSDTKDVAVEEEDKMNLQQEGDVEMILSGYISKDIEDDWAIRKKTGIQRFMRELYDKFGKKDKYDSYESVLKKDIDAIVYDAKVYLKLHRND